MAGLCHSANRVRGNCAGVFDTYGLSAMNQRSGQSAHFADADARRDDHVAIANGVAARMTKRRALQRDADCAAVDAKRETQLARPVGEIDVAARLGATAPHQIDPDAAARARESSTALGSSSARVTALTHQYMP